MTTPGDGKNEIELVIKPVIEDAEQAVRSEGERQAAAFREGVESVGAAQIRPPNTDEMLRQYDAALVRLEERFKEAARNMGLSLQEGSGGSVGLFGGDLEREMDRFRRTMEETGGAPKTTFVGSFAQAVENDNRLLQAGFDRTKEITERNRAWALNAEGRTFLADNPHSVPVGGYHGGAAEQGDLDRLYAAGQKALSRVVVDQTTYAMENGQFFKTSASGSVLRSQGAVEDPALQARLATAVQNQMAQVESQIVNEHLRDVAARPGSVFSEFGIDPTREYSAAGGRAVVPGTNIGEKIGSAAPDVERLSDALVLFRKVALDAPEVITRLERALYGIVEASDAAARAAALEASETERLTLQQALHARLGLRPELQGALGDDEATHRRLEAAFAGPLPQGVPSSIRGLGTAEEYQQDQVRNFQLLARQAAEEERQAQVVAEQRRAYDLSPENQAALAARNQAENEARLARNAANLDRIDPSLLSPDQRQVLEGYRRGASTSGILPPPPPPPPGAPGAAGFPEDPRMTEAFARLQSLFQLTEAQVQAGRLTGFERGDVARAGSRLDGQTIVRGPGEDEFYRVKRGESGSLEQITQTDALARATSDLALASREAARGEELLASAQERALLTGKESIGQLQLQAAIEKENAALASGNPGALASARIAKARAAAAVDEEVNPPASRNFLQAFSHGALGGDKRDDADNAHFRLNADNGEFLGAIARYQAAYAVIFGLSQAFHSVLDEEGQVQTAMIEFSEATGLAGDKADHLANSLADIGSRSGLGPAAAIEAGTKGAFAFADEVGGDGGQTTSDIATTSVRTTAVAAFITQAKDANVVQGQLIATTRSFNLTAEDQGRVLDAAANAARHYGASTADILQGLPGVAAIARQAGLSVEETANIISIAAVRTAQTGTAVSTAIGRVLENINAKPQTKSLLDTFGVDTTGTAGQTLESLAHHWRDLTDAQKDQVVASLGGVRAAKDLIPVLQEGDGLIRKTHDSYAEAGYAQELYYKQLNTLAGVLKTIGGDITLVGHDLAGSHLFDVFGLALKTIDPFLVAIDDVLKAIGGLDNATHGWLIPLLEVAAVLSVIEKHFAVIATEEATAVAESTTLAGTTAATEGIRVGETGALALPLLAGRTGARLTSIPGLAGAGEIGGAGVVTGETAVASGGLAAMGGALLGPAGVVVGLVAMGVAVGAITNAIKSEHEVRHQAEEAYKALRTSGSDPENYRSAASALAAAGVSQEHANSGFGGFIAATPADRQRADQLRVQAEYATAEANRLEAQQRAAAGVTAEDVYFTHTGDRVKDLTNGLAAMSEAGVPAVRALQLLNAQIQGLGSGGPGHPQPLTGVFATEANVGSLTGAVQGALAGTKLGDADILGSTQVQTHSNFLNDVLNAFNAGSNPGSTIARGQDIDAARQKVGGVDPEKIRHSIQGELDSRGIAPGEIIDAPTQAAIAASVIHHLGLDKLLTGQGQSKINGAIRSTLQSTFTSLSTSNAQPPLTDAEFKSLVEGDGKNNKGLTANLQALAAQDNPNSLNPSGARLQAELRLLRGLAAQGHTGGDQVILLEELHKAESDYVKGEITRLDRLQQHGAAAADDPAALLANDVRFTLAKAKVAIGNNDEAALVELLDGASKATIDAVKKALEAEVLLQQAAYNSELAVWNSLPANLKRANAEDAPSGVDLHTAQHNLGSLNTALNSVTPADTPKQDPNTLALAQINARADSRDAVQSARTAVEAAKYTLDHAKNATDRANAQKALNDANNAYTAAVATNTEAIRSAKVDPRDTLGGARTAVANAKTALDATEKGTTAYYQALAAYHSAQATYAQDQRQQAAAAAAANVRQGDPLAAAAASLHSADAALQGELRGTVGWYNALGQFHQAQYAYGQALQAAQREHRLLSIDATDPVKTAQVDVDSARATLARDRHNKTGDITADEIALRDANTREQAAQFSQRLSDVTTAHDLQRISDAAYLSYLQSQHDSLTRVQHRTRQQTDELNQIDSAIKAANDQLSGQFNLGDIKIPTVYEVRRTIALSAGGGAAVGGYQDNRQVSITINGNNLAQMNQVLADHLGSSSTTRVAVAPRKGG